MSRGSFRARVEAPRPASAWMLVTVASASLWITQQLAVWVLAVQALAIVGSLARRTRPFAWQSSAIALNVGMLGITCATIAVALEGGPSTIALAHFAALTQALQLVDARPRRTEFLLVALALFQVVLAANLTDSVFFTPLLVTFVLATVWTLLVHTLHSEAVEAGDHSAASRAVTPGLLRTTLMASGVSILLALMLFVALPRLRSSVVGAARLSPVVATAGFSSRVALGELGRIRQDPTVVLRVETLEGSAPDPASAYWRGLAFDHFDGTSWSITPRRRQPVPGSAEGGVTLGRGPDRSELVQRVTREPVASGVVFGAGETRRLQGTIRNLERDENGGLYAAGQHDERVRYTVATQRRRVGDSALRGDTATPPRQAGDRYLQLPELSEEVAALARRVTSEADDDADRVRALERHLLAHGRYSDTPPRLDPRSPRSAVEAFLFGEMAGHCEYFASALVVLARSIGIPARLVNGFAGGRENGIGGFVELTRSDAHAWAEVHFERAGWVRYDATPPDLRSRPALAALGWHERMRELGSAFELWWYQRVVGFDRADQIHAIKRAWVAWKSFDDGRRQARWRAASRPWTEVLSDLTRWTPWIAVAAGLAGVLALLRRRTARSGAGLPRSYAEALRLLARRGLVRATTATGRDFARAVAVAHPGAAAEAFSALTEAYEEERFGGQPSRAAAVQLQRLREGLRRRTSRCKERPGS